eukprot:CAMPEP_0206131282 /NCGR_PEP_ID=MMETSP1472-20131121/44493_1 /ASSEMBLY_ACC=CAM_ASM_001108 /TAXON_ID=41880 /ORGANISM="Pycnococcus provasolii, Strain RCC251" /LENGTH=83 /DNA_ID=CAMNT_0053522719 /DNA_START=79 /DNA_END=328 /DNA_ORIENTATION=-
MSLHSLMDVYSFLTPARTAGDLRPAGTLPYDRVPPRERERSHAALRLTPPELAKVRTETTVLVPSRDPGRAAMTPAPLAVEHS